MRTRRARQQADAVVSCDLHLSAIFYDLNNRMHGAGLTKEVACFLCAAGKYQTGVGLIAEASCTWCVAGKYQSGSGLKAAFWLYLLMHALVVWMHMRGNIVAL